jgi:hypothetical protein
MAYPGEDPEVHLDPASAKCRDTPFHDGRRCYGAPARIPRSSVPAVHLSFRDTRVSSFKASQVLQHPRTPERRPGGAGRAL